MKRTDERRKRRREGIAAVLQVLCSAAEKEDNCDYKGAASERCGTDSHRSDLSVINTTKPCRDATPARSAGLTPTYSAVQIISS